MVAPEQPHHFVLALEMAVDRAGAAIAGIVDGAALADAGDDVVQDATIRRVVEHVAGHHRRHPGRAAQRLGAGQPRAIVGPALQRQRAPAAIAEARAQPNEIGGQAVVQRLKRPLRQQDGQQPLAQAGEVRPPQLAGALAGTRLAEAEQLAQPGIGLAIGRVEQQRRRVAQVEPTSDHQPEPELGDAVVRPGDPRQAVAVGDRERVHAQLARLQQQLLDMAGAAQERVVGGDLKLDILHADHPHAVQCNDCGVT